MHRIICSLILLAAVAAAQDKNKPWVSNDPIKFKDLNTDALIFKPVHIHYSHKACKSEPDHVYSKTNGIYFACINHEEVCNKSPHSISKRLIDAYEREIREFKEHVESSQREASRRMAEAHAKDQAEWGPRRAADAAMRESRLASSGRVPVTRAGVSSISRGGPVPVEPAIAPPVQVEKLLDERVQEITVGTTREEVIRKLGPPHSKITGESERFTYLLTSGASAKFDLEAGAVTKVRVIPAQ